MADLYGSNESEDMSSFLQVLLHNNSSSSAAPTDSTAGSAAVGSFFTGAAAESSSSINFSDNSYFFANDGLDLSSRVNNIGSTFEGSEASDRQAHLAQRNSSKRSRAAEVHNLTEKRRRSRINEKLKALQNLIPNSNKTDKASMLDEAIEYLKQLQLQVQMLTLRNGLSTHPGYSLGQIQAMLVPPAGLEIDAGNTLLSVNRGTEHQFTRNQDVFIQSALETTNPSSSTQPMLQTHMGVGTNNNSRILPSIVPSMQNHYGLLNHLASSKDICREDTLSRLQLDTSCSGNNSSPEVSS